MSFYTVVTILILALLLILSAALFMRKRLFVAMSVGLKIVYVLTVIGILSALLLPGVYRWAADQSLRAVGVYDRIEALDEKFVLVNVVANPGQTVDNIKDQINGIIGNIWGGNNEGDSSAEDGNAEVVDENEEGYFTKNLYPIFVDLLTSFYRLLTLVVSIILLVVVVYVSYGMSGATDLAMVDRKVARLEARIAELESQRESAPSGDN